MADKDVKLMTELRRVAESHRRTGEPRTADLLERAAQRIGELIWRKTTREETEEITRNALSAGAPQEVK